MNYLESDCSRFYSKVEKTETCWLWTGALREGYGQFRLNGGAYGAHRFSYLIHHGSPEGKFVCHSCDNPSCVNPEHLFLGAHSKNMEDRNVKGRHTFNLTNEQVEDIRSRDLSITMCRDLAKEFNASSTQIKSILTGKSYGWLPGARNIPEQFTSYKLTHDDVLYIAKKMENSKYGDIKKLAEQFGVDRQTIANIKYRRRLYTDTL